MLARPHGQVPSVHFQNVTTPAMQPIQSKLGIEVDPWSISQDLVLLKKFFLILPVYYLEQLTCEAFFEQLWRHHMAISLR